MKTKFLTVVITLTVVICIQGIFILKSNAQERNLEPPFADDPLQSWPTYDPVHNSLMVYRDTVEVERPTLRLYRHGTNAGFTLSALKDFPEAKGLDIWGATGTPEGGVALLAVLQLGGINTRHMILTYDHWGILSKVWDVYPYHHHRIASDSDGNIYAFGHREDRGESAEEEDYPLLVKYSPTGEVVWERLPRSQFPYDKEILVTNSTTGEHSLVYKEGSLWLYVATVSELFRFDAADGRVVARDELEPLLNTIAGSAGGTRCDIIGLGLDRESGIHAHLRIWTVEEDKPRLIGFSHGRLDGNPLGWADLSEPTTQYFGRLLGLTKNNKRIYVRRQRDGGLLLDFQ